MTVIPTPEVAYSIRLLGAPSVRAGDRRLAGPRGRKAWALLAYLVLAERAPRRSRVASLLFGEADDPRGALRWNLAELRRMLPGRLLVDGDPLVVRLASTVALDVVALEASSISAGELLEGIDLEDAPEFETWLAAERRRLASDVLALVIRSVTEAVAGEDYEHGARLAGSALEAEPLDADLHSLLVTCLSRSGDSEGARRQVARCTDVFRRELGHDPPGRVADAAIVARPVPSSPSRVLTLLEVGSAALAAGAVGSGLRQLRRAVAETSIDDEARAALGARARLALASGLIHTMGGRGLEVSTLVHEALIGARTAGQDDLVAEACCELAFLAVQQGHRAEVEHWLAQVDLWRPGVATRARATGLRGMSLSDLGRYDEAATVLDEAVGLARESRRSRQLAWSASMVGRLHLLRGEPSQAADALDLALRTVRTERWAAFEPWPAAFRAETALATGDVGLAEHLLERAWTLAEEARDHCWIATVAHAQALRALTDGHDPDRWLRAGLEAERWYVWPRARLLALAVRSSNDATGAWERELETLVSGGAMSHLLGPARDIAVNRERARTT